MEVASRRRIAGSEEIKEHCKGRENYMSEELPEVMNDRPEFVTIAEFPEPMEAEMARLRLDSAGIETFLSGENAAIMSPGLGPLQLQVRLADEADARAVLADPGEPVSTNYTGPDVEPVS
jgi:hypothetical protein